MFLNHYECPRCDCTWSDALTCQAADDCPACGLGHVPPQDSLAFDDGRELEQAEAA
jgi:hypothetical protein